MANVLVPVWSVTRKIRTLMGKKEGQERRAFLFKNRLKSGDEIDYGA